MKKSLVSSASIGAGPCARAAGAGVDNRGLGVVGGVGGWVMSLSAWCWCWLVRSTVCIFAPLFGKPFVGKRPAASGPI